MACAVLATSMFSSAAMANDVHADAGAAPIVTVDSGDRVRRV
jgi:hypothetical protein